MWAFARAVEEHLRGHSYDVVYGLGKTWTHDVVRLGGGSHKSYLELSHARTLEPWERVVLKGKLKHRVALRIEQRAHGQGAYRAVVTNSQMVRRDVMERYGVPGEDIRVIYNGVDLSRFDPRLREAAGRDLRRELGLADDDFVALFLGTGYGRKGLATLLKAFPAVVREHPKAKLVVVGRDSARGRYEGIGKKLGLGDHAIFLGPRRDTEACYAAADLYVLPTLYDPFANTTLEALASGLPVITTDRNGASEILCESSGSVSRDPEDHGHLAEQVLSWTEPGRLETARARSRRIAEEHSQARVVTESTALLEEVATAASRAC